MCTLVQVEIERFSNECRKTKTKVITPANHNKHNQNSKLIHVTGAKRGKTKGNACEQVGIGLIFASDWSRKWREMF